MNGTEITLNNGPKTLNLVTKAWTATSVKWNSPWSKAGGDFNSTALANSSKTAVQAWEDFDVTSAVTNFVKTPSSNYGFLVKFDKNDYGVKFTSSKGTTIANRPKLTIVCEQNTGIISQNVIAQNAIKILANNNLLQVSLPNQGIANISVANAQGKILTQSSFSGTWSTNVASGMHIVSVTMPNGAKVQQIVVTK